ncbi:PASTA domain-containing protein [Modestobacter excelsi]|uniref:PASTA domain-containing protein n=1 Tax=Modestobacter excelsi TaxID=2213161 RepID=UPI00110D1ACB|nr:PASTA domain-containing protein [Modestobacter excelsi]
MLLVVTLMALHHFFGSDGPSSEEPEPVAVIVPDLAGVQLDLADAQLRELGHRNYVDDGEPRAHDLSPRERYPSPDPEWTVVTTRPAAGQSWEVGKPIYLFALQTTEYVWFTAHPSMPTMPSTVAVADLTAQGQILYEVEELVDFAHAPGHEPEIASTPLMVDRPIAGLADDPSLEPPGEQAARANLARASQYSDAPLIGSVPPTGTPLRAGQLLTVTVGDEPPSEYSSGHTSEGGYGYGYGGGDDDDDFNVPGWACPTRFC